MAARETELFGEAVLSSLGELRASPAATINLLLYELAAAIDLGLGRQARDTVAAIQSFMQDYPELRQKVPEILRPADFLAHAKDKRSELAQTVLNSTALHASTRARTLLEPRFVGWGAVSQKQSIFATDRASRTTETSMLDDLNQ